MKYNDFVWEADFDDVEERDGEIRFEFEMDFGPESDFDFHSGSDLEYDS